MRGHKRVAKCPGHVFDKQTKTWIPKQPRVTALTLVCKTFYHEAIDVLCGENDFEFNSSTIVTRFFDSIGASKTAIRSIFVHEYIKGTAAAFWQSLHPLVNLRSLSLSHDELCQKWPYGRGAKLSVVVSQAEPLLKILHDSYTQQGLSRRVVDVVQVRPDACYTCSRDRTCPTCQDTGCVCDKEPTIKDSEAGHKALVADLKTALTMALAEA
ncbi:hypothetical protein B0A48_18563 [Cryoendolithus antarcticus]|uniref:Uncharacterized protein n=1 Tax=Cryoendolithus antarcticus TaxID=1507870 RepID=A0A1V8S7Z4_9PEZI|nr:hypothetical protein B0A48_18563 [Cryoendolithus antarcticus]